MAVFVWVQSQLVTEHRSVVDLPVNLKSVPKNITLERLPQSIPFNVRGKGFDIIKLKLSRTKVSIDASKIQPGVDVISLTDYTIDLPENINITLLGPADQQEIAVTADVFHQKKIPVQLGYADAFTRQRFSGLKYQIVPDRVIVFGPRNKVQAIESAITEAITREIASERDFIVKLATTGEDVSFSESQVRVRVSNSFNTSRVFDNITIITEAGKSCFPSQATVKLSGDSEFLKQFDPSGIQIRIAPEADTQGLHALSVDLPAGTELVAITPAKVRYK
jgi:YbbR domain-containing protein